jgi:CBS domain-containing protein
MFAADIMTRRPVTVSPDTPLADVIAILLDKRIGAVPVMEGSTLVGVVSETDLLRRAELGSEPHPAGWLGLFVSEDARARAFVQGHGTLARDVMTQPPVTVRADAPVGDVAALLERKGISRVPVLDATGRLAGIVSRSDILRALASRGAGAPAYTPSDRDLREAVMTALEAGGWASDAGDLTVVVEQGVVHLWGSIGADPVHRALLVAAGEVDGVREVRDHLSPWRRPDPMDRPHWQDTPPP